MVIQYIIIYYLKKCISNYIRIKIDNQYLNNINIIIIKS